MAKFKKGDKVRALSDLGSPGRITKGKIYECFGPSDMYPDDMIKIKDNYGSTDGWYEHKFELVEQSTTKHYKWLLYFQDEISKKPIIRKTQHYVSPEKIKSYLDHFKLDHCKDFQMIEDQFVED